MSLSQAFFCLIWFVGCGSVLWFLFEMVHAVCRNKYQRGWRRWPTSQHRSYFSDCRRVPEDEAL